MPSDKKPVEHLQAKPYNPHERRNEGQPNPQQSAQKNAAFFFSQKQRAGGRKKPLKNPLKNSLLGYLLLFFVTALLALFAVLLPVWLVVRFARGRGAS